MGGAEVTAETSRAVCPAPASRPAAVPRGASHPARLAAGLVVALALGACRGGDWRVANLYGGPTSVEVLTAPQAAEAFSIDPAFPPKDPSRPRIGDFTIVSGPVALDAARSRELSAVLLDPETYDWLRAKGAEFRPRIGFRLVKDASRLEIALCLDSDQVLSYRHGRRVMMEDTDAARPRLVALAKALFPDDPHVQALR